MIMIFTSRIPSCFVSNYNKHPEKDRVEGGGMRFTVASNSTKFCRSLDITLESPKNKESCRQAGSKKKTVISNIHFVVVPVVVVVVVVAVVVRLKGKKKRQKINSMLKKKEKSSP